MLTGRDKDVTRKRIDRLESARIFIPECVNPQRRERCLADPELFLKTYFPRDYRRPFGKVHKVLIDAIWQTANYGGKIAMAAPRGRGKTQVVMGMDCYVVLAGKSRFPVLIGPTTEHAKHLYNDFRKKITYNDLLLEDFPEVCHPVRCLDEAPQRRQYIDGKSTRIQWTADGLRLADVPAKYRGPIDYSGVRMEFRGLDAAICGINRDGDRPDFVPIDEPETRESAKSDSQIIDRENAIDKDINGLAGEDCELAQVLITTIRNRKCISFRFTDPDIKPSWMGKRYGWVEKWPDEWTKEDGLWHTYIAMRAQDQRKGDRYGRTATEFYLANEEAMKAGGELMADNFKAVILKDGWQTVHSAWQVVFNAIADTSFDAFRTEYQNDPPEVEEIQTLGLTHAHVANNQDGERGVKPSWASVVVRGIDMGKINCWWVDLAFAMDGTGSVIDYGKFNTFGLSTESSHEAIERAMMTALTNFAAEDCKYTIDYALVDSGYKPDAVYEGCRLTGKDYFPSKGPDSSYRQPKDSDSVKLFYECHATQIQDQYQRPVWLFHPNTEFWKNWLQERWQVDAYTGDTRTPGSMTLFTVNDIRMHTLFAKSMVSERSEHVPLPGKGYKKVWSVLDRSNNHWLDAAGYACAAASCLGVRLIAEPVVPKPERPKPKPFLDPWGRPFVAKYRSV